MSTDTNVNGPSTDANVISPVVVTPPGDMNWTNGAGRPYVVEACQDAADALIANPHDECVVNAAPWPRRSSKPTTHGPAAAGGCADVPSVTGDGDEGTGRELSQPAMAAVKSAARIGWPFRMADLRSNYAPLLAPQSRDRP